MCSWHTVSFLKEQILCTSCTDITTNIPLVNIWHFMPTWFPLCNINHSDIHKNRQCPESCFCDMWAKGWLLLPELRGWIFFDDTELKIFLIFLLLHKKNIFTRVGMRWVVVLTADCNFAHHRGAAACQNKSLVDVMFSVFGHFRLFLHPPQLNNRLFTVSFLFYVLHFSQYFPVIAAFLEANCIAGIRPGKEKKKFCDLKHSPLLVFRSVSLRSESQTAVVNQGSCVMGKQSTISGLAKVTHPACSCGYVT